jgi:penicillin-binding protein 1A
MALPIWALFMKSCYEDETLSISKDEFEKPNELSIRVDCSIQEDLDKKKIEEDDEPEIDF